MADQVVVVDADDGRLFGHGQAGAAKGREGRVALIGLPPSGAFLAKWQLLSSAIALGQWLWVPVVAAGSLMAAAYVFRVLGFAFGPSNGVMQKLADGREGLPALLLAIVATAVLGLGAAAVWHFVAPGALLTEAQR